MSTPAESEFYWSLDLPGLDEQLAAELVQLAAQQGVEGSAIDPTSFLTLHVDRETATTIADALRRAKDDPVAESLLESIEEWLASV
jgi:hypothetical protein